MCRHAFRPLSICCCGIPMLDGLQAQAGCAAWPLLPTPTLFSTKRPMTRLLFMPFVMHRANRHLCLVRENGKARDQREIIRFPLWRVLTNEHGIETRLIRSLNRAEDCKK